MNDILETLSFSWALLQALAHDSDMPFFIAAVSTWPVTAWFIVQDRKESRKIF